ncbi:hypothetical protein TNCV_2751791 [Trichonephila clavipes]|nr:hypothetical protein TNCV_2751791 [Trichonephila clavipes]
MQQERTTQLGSRNETTQLVSRIETTQLNRRKQLHSSVGTKQLNSALPSTACNRLQPPTTAYNRLQPPTTAYNRLQPPTTACNRLQPPATACTAFTAESAFYTYSHITKSRQDPHAAPKTSPDMSDVVIRTQLETGLVTKDYTSPVNAVPR